jgi:hypothetical protein
MTTTNDRIVLYIEETEYKNSKTEVDMRCYILYDEIEHEYFVCGTRMSCENKPYGEFKFYCKRKNDLYEYLSFVMNLSDCNVNVGLFNYPDLFDTHDMVDFNILNECRTEEHEIAFYFKSVLNRKHLCRLLGSLKNVRY